MNGNIMQRIQQISQMMGGIKNPETLAKMMAKKMNNPIANNLIKMAEQGKGEEIHNFAKNMCNERGINFDEQYNSIANLKNMFK